MVGATEDEGREIIGVGGDVDEVSESEGVELKAEVGELEDVLEVIVAECNSTNQLSLSTLPLDLGGDGLEVEIEVGLGEDVLETTGTATSGGQPSPWQKQKKKNY